jgi:hypothetical protein
VGRSVLHPGRLDPLRLAYRNKLSGGQANHAFPRRPRVGVGQNLMLGLHTSIGAPMPWNRVMLSR